MSPGTKAVSVGFKRRESGVETVLLLHFEEQRLIVFLGSLLKCRRFISVVIFVDDKRQTSSTFAGKCEQALSLVRCWLVCSASRVTFDAANVVRLP